jgi:pilus assembly protein Flp/PilA
MRSVLKAIVKFLRREDGPTAVEYAVMLAMIIVVCYVAIIVLGQNTNQLYNEPKLQKALQSGS